MFIISIGFVGINVTLATALAEERSKGSLDLTHRSRAALPFASAHVLITSADKDRFRVHPVLCEWTDFQR